MAFLGGLADACCQPIRAFPESREYADTQSRTVKGKPSPAAKQFVSADPFCGDTPQRPESESADGVSVTG
jgi:hypothetical protein